MLVWQNEDPQPVCYVDGEMLEEDIQERIKLLIPTLGVDQDLLRENFLFVSSVSQPDAIEDFLSLELDENQMELLSWIKIHTGEGKHPLIVLDNLSNLVELGDDNSAGQMQNFKMMVTKARKMGCSLIIVHHTGKNLNPGPDGVPTWRGSYDMATRLDKTICLLPCPSSMDGYVTFQVLEGKSRRGQRLNTSIQLNPFDKKWELFDETITEDRHQMITDLDQLNNPNAVTTENAGIDLYWNAIQTSFPGWWYGNQTPMLQLARVACMTWGASYTEAYNPSDFNGSWNSKDEANERAI